MIKLLIFCACQFVDSLLGRNRRTIWAGGPPINLGSFSDYKLSGNDYTNKKTSNLLDTKNLPKKPKVPFSKVIIRHFFRLHVSRVYRGFALHLCFTFYEACTKLALVFYNLSSTASVSRELPPLYFLSIFSNYKHPPPLPCNKTVGLAIVGSGWAA